MNPTDRPAQNHVFARTHVGRVRARNEDALAVNGWLCTGEREAVHREDLATETGLRLVLADGMGGLPCGQQASALIVGAVARQLDAHAETAGLDTVRDGIRAAQSELSRAVRERPDCAGMGATLAGALLHGSRACHYNIGDSRVYLFRAGSLRQLSTDDRLGRHRLTRAIGGFSLDEPGDLHEGVVALESGDRLLLCSDGLTDVVSDARIEAALHASPSDGVDALIDEALDAGGPDNISIIVAACA